MSVNGFDSSGAVGGIIRKELTIGEQLFPPNEYRMACAMFAVSGSNKYTLILASREGFLEPRGPAQESSSDKLRVNYQAVTGSGTLVQAIQDHGYRAGGSPSFVVLQVRKNTAYHCVQEPSLTLARLVYGTQETACIGDYLIKKVEGMRIDQSGNMELDLPGARPCEPILHIRVHTNLKGMAFDVLQKIIRDIPQTDRRTPHNSHESSMQFFVSLQGSVVASVRSSLGRLTAVVSEVAAEIPIWNQGGSD